MRVTRKLLAATAMLGLVGGLTACLAEEEVPEEVSPVVQEPTPTPEPEPEPEPMPGNGPECPTDHCVSVTVSGDLLFHPGLWAPYAIQTDENGHNFDFEGLFAGLRPYLAKADLNICQAETPFADFGGPYYGYPMFSTPPEVLFAAKDVGFDVCTMASNHSVDQGTEGLNRSIDLMEQVGLAHTGTYKTPEAKDEVLIVEANGVKIALINSTFSLNGLYAEYDWQVDYPIERERMVEKAKKARELGAEIVIAAFHEGEEYWNEPTWLQEEDAQFLMNSGMFDLVYSHHSHAIQPLQFFEGRWILYSPGNLISESAPPERHMNNEFLLTRFQFAKQDDGTWKPNDTSWVAATNTQDGIYRWCSVASDAPQGVCQWPEFDADVRERTRATVNLYGAAEAGAREWLITEEQ